MNDLLRSNATQSEIDVYTSGAYCSGSCKPASGLSDIFMKLRILTVSESSLPRLIGQKVVSSSTDLASSARLIPALARKLYSRPPAEFSFILDGQKFISARGGREIRTQRNSR